MKDMIDLKNIFGKKKQYSYVKKPFSKNGWMALVLTVTAFLLSEGILCFSVVNSGKVGIFIAAGAICAILLNFAGTAFSLAGLFEKEKNYIVVIICLVVEVLIFLEWFFVYLF